MRHFNSFLAGFVVLFCCFGQIESAEWISDPSYYTHSPETGTRVTQFAPVGPFYWPARPDFVESGYHHERSSIRVGDSSDNYVRVTRWGEPVRPYGEWQFPYRPYSVPYDMWGPPFPQFGYAPYYGVGPGFGPGFGPGDGPGVGPGVGFPDSRRLPYAQPFTNDTWYDRRTRPQGRAPRQDPYDTQFFYRRDEAWRDPLEGMPPGDMDG